jgi:all-trans-retinol 13,14-reductase
MRNDIVIIGGGLGGLLCGVILAKAGLRVCVLEKNRQIGGCLQTFAFQKKVFDACVHYVGGLGEGHTLHRILKYVGVMDDLPVRPLNEQGFDRIIFGDEAIEYPLATKPYFKNELLHYFPEEGAAIDAYLKLVSDTAERFPLYNLRSGDASEKAGLLGMELIESLRALTANERLVQVLAGNNLLYAGVEGLTPFYNHAMSTEAYLHSVHKIVPGSSRLAAALWRQLQHFGGTIERHAQVSGLELDGDRIAFAETADGRRFYGETFISAVHPKILFGLTDSKQLRPAFRERVGRLAQTPPAVMVNVVLAAGKLPFPGHNVYWHPSGEALAKQTADGICWPDTQAMFYAEDDARPGFAESLSILAYADPEHFAAWNESKNITGVRARRSEDYARQKEAYTRALLAKTYRRFPELEAAAIGHTLATPLTFRDYTGNPGGSLYGALKDVHNPAQHMLSVRTRIPNLLLTGQHVNMHGVMGVSMTALATCGEILGLDRLLAQVRGEALA